VKKIELGAPGEFEQLTNEELQLAIIEWTRETRRTRPRRSRKVANGMAADYFSGR
jgi:hypothetical protein